MIANMPSPSQVANSDYLFARHLLKIQDERTNIVPFEYNVIQLDIDKHKALRNLVIKPRKRGVSTYVQGRKFRLLTTGSCLSATMANDKGNTLKLRRISNRFYDELPDGFKPVRGEASASMMTYPLYNSEDQIFTAGSPESTRAGTVTFFHGSEVAYWKNEADVLTAIFGAMPLHGEVWLESTANGAQGKFYNMVMDAYNGNPFYKLHFYRWFDEPDLRIPLDHDGEIIILKDSEESELIRLHNLDLEQIKWRRFRVEQDPIKFKQEYPEDIHSCFLVSGDGFFGDTQGFFDTALNTSQPDESKQYVAGLDFGYSNDATVLSIGCLGDGVQVATLVMNNVKNWDEQYRRIALECVKWNVLSVLGDSTGLQTSIIAGLNNVMREHEATARVSGFVFTSKDKANLMTGLHHALHSGEIKLMDIEAQKHEFRSFIAKQTQSGVWRYTHPDGGHDDYIDAVALMYRAMRAGSMSFEAFTL